jgi:hypothetical protein
VTSNALPTTSSRGGARPADRVGDWSGTAIAGGVAATLALIAIVAGWRGSDLPAQLFRVELFRRDGFVFWDSQWFAGHSTLNYSVLSPVLGAITGAVLLGALSGVLSALIFDRLVRHEFGIGVAVTFASFWFAVSTVTNLVVGRVTFALGVMFALGALLALQRRHLTIGLACALCCGLASPVAGLFLAIAAGAYGLSQRSARAASWLTAAMAMAPVLVIAMAFPSPGMQPYEWWALVCDLALCALFFAIATPRFPAIRNAAVVYAIVLVVTKLTENPLGGNVSRLNQYAAAPLLICLLWERRRVLLVLLLIPFIYWQWFPALDTIAFAGADPSTHTAYYQPLLGYLAANPSGFGRVEIPVTYRHWETAVVALARGWERQLDYAFDEQFYNGTLTPASYRTWLAANGVRYVALPDTRLDPSSKIEARIIERGESYLRPVWHSAHWKVFEFSGYHGLVDGPAQLVSLKSDGFTLHVTGPGTITVHIHDSPHWAIAGGGCTTTSPDGWTELHDVQPGTVAVGQALRGTRCDLDK